MNAGVIAARAAHPTPMEPLRVTPRNERTLEAIATLGHPTGSERSLGEFLERVARLTSDALDYRVCVIYLYDRHDDTFYVEATHGIGVEERHELLATPVPMRVVDKLVTDGYRMDWTYFIPASASVWSDPAVSACFGMPAMAPRTLQPAWRPGDVLLAPLEIEKSGLIGFMVVDEPVDGLLPDAAQRLGLASLAMSCANAVDGAHLYKTQREEAAISSALLQIAEAAGTPDEDLLFARASATLADLLGAEQCAVWHVEDDVVSLHLVVDALDWQSRSDEVQALWDRDGGLRATVERGEPVLAERAGGSRAGDLVARLDLTSALLIPLFLHNGLAGAIVVGWKRAPHRFRARDLDIARGMSRLVGIALQNARLYRDTTRQAESNARLYAREREAVQRLQELDQLRNDFVSTVSHELRTPLTGIKGFTETLLNYWERMDDTRRTTMVRRISASAQRLDRLVQDLLFISRVEAGSLPLRRAVVALQPLVEGAVQEVEAKYRGQEIQIRPPACDVSLVADPDRIQQVLANLLDNAAKYSPEGRPIRVRWTRHARGVRVAVVDRGPGIDRGDMSRLFTRFGKLDRTPRAGHVGTGLGLYISKNLIEAMNGHIDVWSHPGWGSIFTVTLPGVADC